MKKILIVDDMEGWRNFNKNAVIAVLGNNIEIDTSDSAENAYNKILENNKNPYDIIITDLQMESLYEPKYAGEWLTEQVKTLPDYYKTKIIIISATYNIKQIAEELGVFYIPKSIAGTTLSAYESLLN